MITHVNAVNTGGRWRRAGGKVDQNPFDPAMAPRSHAAWKYGFENKWTPEEIKWLRVDVLGISQKRFARMLGFTRKATVSELENASKKVNERLADLLDAIEAEQNDMRQAA